jgi:hypothetical protein
MNETLFKNIISQFDFELQNLLNNFCNNHPTPNMSDYIELQTKLETLIKQRRDSVDYAKKQLGAL